MLNTDPTTRLEYLSALTIVYKSDDDVYLMSDNLWYYRTADEDLYGGCGSEADCREELALYLEWLG